MGRWRVADDVEGGGCGVGPAGVVHRSEGCGTIAGVGIEGDAVERMDVWREVVPEGVAVDRRWLGGGGGGVGRDGDGREVDVVGVLKLDIKVVLPAVVVGGVGNGCSVK